jgi:eukaryotic-like serine/threonine-protein kinase
MSDAQSFGKYMLVRKLAAGGMGEVFLAKQQGPEGFEKFLVIKRILSHHTDNPDYVDMFFAEARLAAKMSHSNIVQIFEMGEIDGAYFIAMEYVNGKSMKDIIDAAKAKGITLEPAHIAEMIIKLASGLGYAHNLRDMSGNVLNIIHRDVNPHNALVSYGGETKVIDFGIAKSDFNSHKTETGTIKGKFVYMSPEQSAAEKIDKRSDIFSIGIVLYEMLAGENPFQKPNIVLSLDAIQRFSPPPPSTLNPAFVPFDAVVEKALKKSALDRYQDCHDMVADLQRLLGTGEIPKPSLSLQQLMHELFHEQIEKEQRFVQEFLKANSASATSTALPPRPPRPKPQHSFAGSQDLTQAQATSPELVPPVRMGNETTAGVKPRPGSAMNRRRKTRMFAYLWVGVILLSASIAVAVIISKSKPKHQVVLDMNTIALSPPEPNPTPPEPVQVMAQNPTPVNPMTQAPPLPAGTTGTVAPPVATPGTVAPPVATPRPTPTNIPDDPRPEPSHPSMGVKGPPKKVKVAEEHDAIEGVQLFIYSTPAAPVSRDGKRIASTKVELLRERGEIRVGDGSTPFQVTFKYKVASDKSVDLTIDSSPWAILRRDGISVGRTPRSVAIDGAQHRYEFSSPGVDAMTLIVR